MVGHLVDFQARMFSDEVKSGEKALAEDSRASDEQNRTVLHSAILRDRMFLFTGTSMGDVLLFKQEELSSG